MPYSGRWHRIVANRTHPPLALAKHSFPPMNMKLHITSKQRRCASRPNHRNVKKKKKAWRNRPLPHSTPVQQQLDFASPGLWDRRSHRIPMSHLAKTTTKKRRRQHSYLLLCRLMYVIVGSRGGPQNKAQAMMNSPKFAQSKHLNAKSIAGPRVVAL